MGVTAMKIDVLLEICSFFWTPNRGSKLLCIHIPSAIRTIFVDGGKSRRKNLPGEAVVVTMEYLEVHPLDRRV